MRDFMRTQTTFSQTTFSNIKKWGISKNKHLINCKTEKESKMKFFDFVMTHNLWVSIPLDSILPVSQFFSCLCVRKQVEIYEC